MPRRVLGSGGRLPWRLPAVALIFFSIAVFSAVMTNAAIGIQSAVRAMVIFSSHWANAQREAVHRLERYGAFGDPADLQAFERTMVVPMAARAARQMLRNGSDDIGAIGRALVVAGAHPEDVDGMIDLFRCCLRWPMFGELKAAWNSGAATWDEIDRIGQMLQTQRLQRRDAATAGPGLQERFEAIEAMMARDHRALRQALDTTSLWVRQELRQLNLVVVALLLGIGLCATVRIIVGQRNFDRQFRSLLDSAGDGFLVVDPNRGAVVQANRAAERMLGLPSTVLIGKPYRDLFIGDAPAVGGAAGMRAAVLRGPFDTHVDVEVNCGPAEWAGRPAMVAVVRDIGARLMAEQERRIATNAMANISEAIVITDDRLRIVTVNRAFSVITGRSVSEVQGRMPSWVRFGGISVPRRREIWQTLMREGRWQGEVPGERGDGSHFPQRVSIAAIRDPLGRLTHYVGLFSDHSAMREHERRLQHQASHDLLTALPNRGALEAQAARVLRMAESDGRSVALMFVDLDGFKAINDTYGHAAGDEVLRVMGHRIRSVLRAGDFVARVGGDEFNLLLEHVGAERDAARVAQMLLELAAEPIDCNGHVLTVSSSIGISFFPRDARAFSALAACADLAMYEAKHRGRNNFQIYSPQISQAAEQRTAMITALRQAVADDLLSLHFQPVVDLLTGDIVGLQALLRWTHPEFGAVPPGRFVPLAEEAGVIDQLTFWVLREACRRAARWRAQGLGEPRIAVKLTGRNIRDVGLPSRVAEALSVADWPASRLLLEVSDLAINHRHGIVQQSLRSLAGLGVGIAVDGFGAGQATPAQLRELPVSVLKIGRGFSEGLPRDRESLALVRSLVVLAQGLGLDVVAEGVESAAQHEALRAEGCGLGVGYFYGHPMAAEAVEPLLRDGVIRRIGVGEQIRAQRLPQ